MSTLTPPEETGLRAVVAEDETLIRLDLVEVLTGAGYRVVAEAGDGRAAVEAVREHRPDIVFHAAALKHLPMLERFPLEGWRTNVLGTRNVLQAAHSVGVQRFVNISTDKAAAPTSVLGSTKRLAEA